MAVPFLNNLDLSLNELQNAKIQLLATDPASPPDGRVWVNTTSGVLKVRLAGATISLGRLDQISPPTADVSMNSRKLTNLADGTAASDAATKGQLDNLAAGLAWKDEVRAATTGNIALTGAQTIDGVALVAGERVLVKNQTAGAENGIYVVAAGAWARSEDANTAAKIQQAAAFVMEGTANGDTAWVMTTNAPLTLGTTALAFSRFAGGAASGINKFAANVGDGVATTIAVTHNLGTTDVHAEVYETAAPRNKVYPDVRVTDPNTVTLIFASAPAAGAFRCVVVG